MGLVLRNVSKIYSNDKNKFYALKDINISFPEKGLVSIVGPSGCGKSTLLNILSGIDKPEQGDVLYDGYEIYKFSKRHKITYRNQITGIVFQSYNLLENESAFTNISIPMRIGGKNKKECLSRAIDLFSFVGLNKEMLYKSVNSFSGGEKQRISVARAISNNPKIIFADEPTGALDSLNSIKIMDILKKISETSLVILVSHDCKLVETYSDYVLSLKDGKLISSNLPNETSLSKKKIVKRKIKTSSWISSLAISNLRKRKGRNVISAITLGFSLLFTFLIAGFSIGSKASSLLEAEKQFDYGTMNLSYELSSNKNENGLQLIKKSRPTKEDIPLLEEKHKNLIIDYDISYFVPQVINFLMNDTFFENVLFSPIYSFKEPYVDNDLLIKGRLPKFDNYDEVVINELLYQNLQKTLGFDPLNNYLNLPLRNDIDNFYFANNYIKDYFSLDLSIYIVGVVKEFSFLTSSKIYYSYLGYKNLLEEEHLTSEEGISYFDLIKYCEDNNPISSYGLKTFLKDINQKDVVKKAVDNSTNYVFYSDAYMKENAFLDLIEASTIGLVLFLIITIVGTALIIGIISFSSYSDDKKEIAILFVLGSNKSQVLDLYLYENLILSAIAILFSLLLSPIFCLIGNLILYKIIQIDNLITPLVLKINGIGLIPTILIVVITILITFLSTYLPIKFASGIKLKEELKDD